MRKSKEKMRKLSAFYYRFKMYMTSLVLKNFNFLFIYILIKKDIGKTQFGTKRLFILNIIECYLIYIINNPEKKNLYLG